MGNYKSLIKEIEDLSSLRDSLCSWIVKTKLWIPLSVIYRLYPSPMRMPASWFVNTDKLNLWYKQKGLKEEEQSQRIVTIQLQNFLWNHRDQDPMELAKQKVYMSGNKMQSPGTHSLVYSWETPVQSQLRSHSTTHQFSSKLSRSSKQGSSERLPRQEEP